MKKSLHYAGRSKDPAIFSERWEGPELGLQLKTKVLRLNRRDQTAYGANSMVNINRHSIVAVLKRTVLLKGQGIHRSCIESTAVVLYWELSSCNRLDLLENIQSLFRTWCRLFRMSECNGNCSSAGALGVQLRQPAKSSPFIRTKYNEVCDQERRVRY